MGAIAEAFGAFVQPLLDQTDGSAEQLNKALRIGQLCYNLALLPLDERAKAIDEMRSTFDTDEEFEDFRRTIVAPMIRRHEQMFPRMHRRDAADESRMKSARIVPWGAATPRDTQPSLTQPSLTQPSLTQRPVDRYAPCPCNSGKKYKFCCGLKRG